MQENPGCRIFLLAKLRVLILFVVAVVVLFFVVGFFGGAGVSTQGIALTRLVLYCLSHAASPFCSG
jgi:hypothetical protein